MDKMAIARRKCARGAVLTLQGDFKKVQSLANGHVLCGAGASLATVCSFARGQGLTGLEFAWGIPGQLGGAVYMNAGAYGGQTSDVLESVDVYVPSKRGQRGSVCTLDVDQLNMGYRKSRVNTDGLIVLSATFKLTPDSPDAIRFAMDDFQARREEKQPLDMPSAGSTFKRPQGHFAAALIDHILHNAAHFFGSFGRKHLAHRDRLEQTVLPDALRQRGQLLLVKAFPRLKGRRVDLVDGQRE